MVGHRGYFLLNDALDLNQALINYGLSFLRKKGYTKIMTPFFIRKDMMARTAQLSQFDEELYNVVEKSRTSETGDAERAREKLKNTAQDENTKDTKKSEEAELTGEEKYLIATSEQPISCFHSNEWFDKPSEQLPIR